MTSRSIKALGCLLFASMLAGLPACSPQTAKTTKGASFKLSTPDAVGTPTNPVVSADADCQIKFQDARASCLTPTSTGALSCSKCRVPAPVGMCSWPQATTCPSRPIVNTQNNTTAQLPALIDTPKPSSLVLPNGNSSSIGNVCWYRIYGSSSGCAMVNSSYQVDVIVAPQNIISQF